MDKANRDEIACRRLAVRLTIKGKRPGEILKQIPRSRQWLHKWQGRFEQGGWAGLASQSRQPHHLSQEYPSSARTVVLRVRRRLQRNCVGLVGARAVRQEILRARLLRPVPAVATIKRWLKAAGLSRRVRPMPEKVYYPEPRLDANGVLHGMDWIARYLEGGEKVFVFHTLDAQSRALGQTISTDKTVTSVRAHVLAVWQRLGLPDILQLDNDSAFTGGGKTPRRFGVVVRLALYLGIELLFTPPAEPKRNGMVEGVNGLWAGSFWERDHFGSVAEVVRKSRKFTEWYAHRYCPPALAGLTPAQAQRRVKRQRLTPAQARALPEHLPLTAGRLHFIRRVSAEGVISFRGERWKVSKRLAHEYVWATVILPARRLEIYHRRSERGEARLIKVYAYALPERVQRLRPEFRRHRVRRAVLKML
jgi:hypothetical protein